MVFRVTYCIQYGQPYNYKPTPALCFQVSNILTGTVTEISSFVADICILAHGLPSSIELMTRTVMKVLHKHISH
jgi:hypothetical protein